MNDLEKIREGYYKIPGTDNYDLTLIELGDDTGMPMLKHIPLPIPSFETPEPTRKLAFVINRFGQEEMIELTLINKTPFLATVGGLAYQGRLKK